MNMRDFSDAMRAAKEAQASVQPAGFDSAKQIVVCDLCGVNTANPVRVWRDGLTLVDMCRPCYVARKEK